MLPFRLRGIRTRRVVGSNVANNKFSAKTPALDSLLSNVLLPAENDSKNNDNDNDSDNNDIDHDDGDSDDNDNDGDDDDHDDNDDNDDDDDDNVPFVYPTRATTGNPSLFLLSLLCSLLLVRISISFFKVTILSRITRLSVSNFVSPGPRIPNEQMNEGL